MLQQLAGAPLRQTSKNHLFYMSFRFLLCIEDISKYVEIMEYPFYSNHQQIYACIIRKKKSKRTIAKMILKTFLLIQFSKKKTFVINFHVLHWICKC